MAQVIIFQDFKSFLRISIRTWLIDQNPCETSHFLAIGVLTQRCRARRVPVSLPSSKVRENLFFSSAPATSSGGCGPLGRLLYVKSIHPEIAGSAREPEARSFNMIGATYSEGFSQGLPGEVVDGRLGGWVREKRISVPAGGRAFGQTGSVNVDVRVRGSQLRLRLSPTNRNS